MAIDEAGLASAIAAMMGKAHDAGGDPAAASAALAAAIVTCIKSAQVNPGAMANSGGPVTGLGTLS